MSRKRIACAKYLTQEGYNESDSDDSEADPTFSPGKGDFYSNDSDLDFEMSDISDNKSRSHAQSVVNLSQDSDITQISESYVPPSFANNKDDSVES